MLEIYKQSEENDAKQDIQHYRQIMQNNQDHQMVSVSSLNHNQYQSFFQNLNQNQNESIEQLYQKLKENGFVINFQNGNKSKNIFQNEREYSFQIKVVKRCKTWKFTQLQCKLGIYQKNILILNNQHESQVHTLHKIDGTMGKIFLFQNQNEESNFSIKCIEIEDSQSESIQERNLSHVLLAIKQYFILCMMSALEIGPKVISYAGFDLILNRTCIQFSMQTCRDFKIQQINSDSINCLKTSLRRMHRLKIVHNDIKPSNIMFSLRRNKILFIDFGLSDVLRQTQKQQTFTSFKGTPAFCGIKMRTCLKASNYVNLYQNDVFCFISALNFIQNQKIQSLNNIFMQATLFKDPNKMISKQALNNFQQLLVFGLISQIKFYLIQRKILNAIQVIQNQKQKNISRFLGIKNRICKEIYNFLSQLSYKDEFWEFYRYIYFLQKQGQNEEKTSNNSNILSHFKKQSLVLPLKQKDLSSINNQKFYCRLMQISNIKFVFQNQKIKEILLTQQQNLYIQLTTYFSMFVSFLSFYNNKFNANLKQKYQASLIFITFHKSKFIEDVQIAELFKNYPLNFLPNLDHVQSQQLKGVIQCIKICLAIVDKNIDNSLYRQLFMDLVKESILLDFNFFYLHQFFFKNAVILQTNIIKKIKNCLQFYFECNRILKSKVKIWNQKQIKNQIDKNQQQKQQQLPFSHYFYEHQMIIQQLNSLRSLFQYKSSKSQSTVNQSLQIQYLDLSVECLQNKIVNLQHLQYKVQNILAVYQKQKQKQNILFSQITYITFNICEALITKIKSISSNYYHNQLNPFILNRYQNCKYHYEKHFQYFIPNSKQLNNSTQRLNGQVTSFDKKVNCQKISHTFFIRQRIRMAFSKNLQNRQTQITEFVSKICKNQIVQFSNLQTLYNIFWKFADLTTNKILINKKLNPVYQIIKNWMIFSLDKLSKDFVKIQSIRQLQKAQNLTIIILIHHAFLVYIQNDSQFILQENVYLHAIIQRLDQIYTLTKKKKIYINYKIQELYTLLLLHYYQKINPDKQRLFSTLITFLDKSVIKTQTIQHSSMISMIIKCVTYKFYYLSNQKINERDSLIIYKSLQHKLSIYFQSIQPLLSMVLHTLFNNQMFQQIITFFKAISKFIMQFYSQTSIQRFIMQISKFYVYVKSCQSEQQQCNCIQIKSKLQSFNLFLQQWLINNNNNIQVTWQNCLLSIILIMNLNTFHKNITIKQIMLKFIAQSFSFLSFSVRTYIHRSYYLLVSRLHQKYSQKKRFFLKKFVSNAQILFSIQYLKNIYLKNFKTKNQTINSERFVQKLIQKISKKHLNKQNLKLQKPYSYSLSLNQQKIINKNENNSSICLFKSTYLAYLNLNFQNKSVCLPSSIKQQYTLKLQAFLSKFQILLQNKK